jgi:phospholipid/cholesterol/gamma-HCH transport system ATP-binding protein
MRRSGEAFVKQFVRGEPDGPIPFHYPAPGYQADLDGDLSALPAAAVHG